MYWKFKDSVSQSPAALCLSDIQLLLLFTARYCGDFLLAQVSWAGEPGMGLGAPDPQGNLLI